MKTTLVAVVTLLFLSFGCSSTQSAQQPDVIVVEGRVNQRGNSPLQAWMIETDNRNTYVLVMDADPAEVSGSTRYRVTGRLYKDQWNGRDYAHLDVTDMVPAN